MYLKCITDAQNTAGKLTTVVAVGLLTFSDYLIKLLSGNGDQY